MYRYNHNVDGSILLPFIEIFATLLIITTIAKKVITATIKFIFKMK